MRKLRFLFIPLIALMLASCTRNTLIVVAPTNPAAMAKKEKEIVAERKAARKCELSEAEKKKFLGVNPFAINAAPPTGDAIPKKLSEARLDGCAAIEYQLDEKGMPFNPRVLREEPKGYGLAENLIKSLMRITFRAPPKQGEWYLMTNVVITSTRDKK